MRTAGLKSTSDACAFVDGLGPDAIGEILIADDDGPRGAVFIEGGRVCWAAARGMSRRLSQLIAEKASIDPETMESQFVLCRREHKHLGEHLVGEKMIEADALREALLMHTLESLSESLKQESWAEWLPRPGKGYGPQFTFATSELLARQGARAHAAHHSQVMPALRALFGAGEWAAAFLRGGERSCPELVAIHGQVPDPGTRLLGFGKWAAGVVDVASAFSDEGAFYCVDKSTSREPRRLVAFTEGELLIAGETGTHGPARILNRRAQQRRAR